MEPERESERGESHPKLQISISAADSANEISPNWLLTMRRKSGKIAECKETNTARPTGGAVVPSLSFFRLLLEFS